MSALPKILILNPISDRQKSFITEVAPAATIVTTDIKHAAEQIGDAEILVAWGSTTFGLFSSKPKTCVGSMH
jgi:hypothetical protein